MGIEDTIGSQYEIPSCVVCGKNVQGDRGFARINHEGIMVNLCCPGCMDTFSNDPEPYVARLRKESVYQELRKLTKSEDEI